MSTIRQRLGAWGFDYVRLRFGLRTALAACIALIAGWGFGLEHPQWAAMTVWAVSQPTRGLLVEKALYRAAGTLLGTAFGMLLAFWAGDSIFWLVLGLSIWVTLCVYTGSLLHGLVSYGTILAGYSASMVVLLTQSPDALVPLGVDRLLTVLTGIITALIIGWLFTYQRAEQSVVNQLRRQTAANLQALAQHFEDPGSNPIKLDSMLTDLAAIEAQLTDHGTGSKSAHRSARTIRHVLNSQLALISEVSRDSVNPNTTVSNHLRYASLKITASAHRNEIMTALHEAYRQLESEPLRRRFDDFNKATETRLSFRDTAQTAASISLHRPVLHRDWVGAKQAAIRTLLIMLMIGSLWWATGWFQIAYLLLGASVMLTLFSTQDNPASAMKYVFYGQCVAAVAAVTMQGVVWSQLESTLAMISAMMPVILFAPLAMAHQRTARSAMDFNLVFLLLMQPAIPYGFSLPQASSIALAVIAAPLAALLAYRLIFPTNLKVRYKHLLRAANNDSARLQTSELPTTQQRLEARLIHRVFCLTQYANELGLSDSEPRLALLEALSPGRRPFISSR